MEVYLIGNKKLGYYKVGIAKTPRWRVHDLDRPKLPFELELLAQYDAGAYAAGVERLLHKRFADRKIRGEWFCDISARRFMKNAIVCYREMLNKRGLQ